MCSAIHITSRTWLRPSSTREPSDPPSRVVSTSTPTLLVPKALTMTTIETCQVSTNQRSGAERPPEGRRHIERGA